MREYAAILGLVIHTKVDVQWGDYNWIEFPTFSSGAAFVAMAQKDGVKKLNGLYLHQPDYNADTQTYNVSV